MLDSNEIKELVDPNIGDNYDRKEMDHMTAALCIEQSSILRPRMSQVSTNSRQISHYFSELTIHDDLIGRGHHTLFHEVSAS